MIDVPALVVHGDDDQIVPFDASAKLSSQIIRDAELKVYAGAPHGLTITHAEFNADLLAFARSDVRDGAPGRRRSVVPAAGRQPDHPS